MGMAMIREAKGLVLFSSVASILIGVALLFVFMFMLHYMGGDLRTEAVRMYGDVNR